MRKIKSRHARFCDGNVQLSAFHVPTDKMHVWSWRFTFVFWRLHGMITLKPGEDELINERKKRNI